MVPSNFEFLRVLPRKSSDLPEYPSSRLSRSPDPDISRGCQCQAVWSKPFPSRFACLLGSDAVTPHCCEPTCGSVFPTREPSFDSQALPRPVEWRRSEEHTSELQSLRHLVCRLLLEKKIII